MRLMETLALDSRCAQRETLEGRAGPVQGLLAEAIAMPRVAPLPPRRTPTLTLDFSAMVDAMVNQVAERPLPQAEISEF